MTRIQALLPAPSHDKSTLLSDGYIGSAIIDAHVIVVVFPLKRRETIFNNSSSTYDVQILELEII